jgi:hypothetical protein
MTEEDIPIELNFSTWDFRKGYNSVFTKNIVGREISGLFDFRKEFPINNLEYLINFVKKVFDNIEELDKRAKKLLQSKYSFENLFFDFLVFKKGYRIKLGYPIKEEITYYYVVFDKNFIMDEEIIFEIDYHME